MLCCYAGLQIAMVVSINSYIYIHYIMQIRQCKAKMVCCKISKGERGMGLDSWSII